MRAVLLANLFVLFWTTAAFAQKVGDRIIVVTYSAVIDEAKVSSPVYRGTVLKIEQIKGESYWVHPYDKKGWIHSEDVIPFDQGIEFFTEEIRKRPNVGDLVARARIWNEKCEPGKAMQDFDEAVRLDPGASAYSFRAIEWLFRGEFDKAIADQTEAIRLDEVSDSTFQISSSYLSRGDFWMYKREYDKAIADYSEAIRVDPETAGCVYHRRAMAWQAKCDYDKAIADCDEKIRDDPNLSFGYVCRGLVWSDKGDYDKAISDFDKAIRLDSTSSRAYDARAWFRATCPSERFRDGAKAIDDAKKALELWAWNIIPHDIMHTLAAAHAEAGDFQNAVKLQEKAIELTPKWEPKWENDAYRLQLDLYKSGMPFRDGPKK